MDADTKDTATNAARGAASKKKHVEQLFDGPGSIALTINRQCWVDAAAGDTDDDDDECYDDKYDVTNNKPTSIPAF